ncbi:DUF2249 domain-containing protein [uncultured Cellulomonas sp.]|uniref:DUF2249 domain-containing protein n=1 Tax=uncultured Cellulomonas sp. TaxID=189682 RepID=UPI0028E6EC89|nr:DUF2249 domain-containing protein [uncultured Cellulomonas sp.]
MTTQHVEISTGTTAPAEAHVCGCGHATDEEIVLDARTLPRPIRHAAIRGAFGAIPVGQSMVLVAPHKPVRLLAELEQDAAGALTFEFLLDEPTECRVRLTRV